MLPPSGSKELLDQQAAAKGADGKDPLKWKRIVSDLCAETKERRKVPCVGLQEVITDWLGSREIDLLKIDAQGFDLQVVRSAGVAIRRVKTIVLEVQNDDVAKLYQDQATCSEVITAVELLGFSAAADSRTLCSQVRTTQTHPNHQLAYRGISDPVKW